MTFLLAAWKWILSLRESEWRLEDYLEVLAVSAAVAACIVFAVLIMSRALAILGTTHTRAPFVRVAVPAVLAWLILRWLVMLAAYLLDLEVERLERLVFFGLRLAFSHDGWLWLVAGFLITEVGWTLAIFAVVAVAHRIRRRVPRMGDAG